MKTIAFHTLGCKVNTYESNAMLKIFNEAGYQEVDFKEIADVYVINTCTVTNTGDSKSRQMIRKAIRKNPQATVCVVGCYSQIAPEEIEQIEGVGVVLGTQHRKDIVKYVDEYFGNLSEDLGGITDEDADKMIEVVEKFYIVMSNRK